MAIATFIIYTPSELQEPHPPFFVSKAPRCTGLLALVVHAGLYLLKLHFYEQARVRGLHPGLIIRVTPATQLRYTGKRIPSKELKSPMWPAVVGSQSQFPLPYGPNYGALLGFQGRSHFHSELSTWLEST